MSDARPSVVVVGPVPPPVHGAARVTEEVARGLRADGTGILVIDTSGTDGTGSRAAYHVRRLAVHLAAVPRLWWARRTARSLYLTGAGGLGLWYQLIVALAARATGYRTVFHHHSYAYVTRRSPAMAVLLRWGGVAEHVVLDGLMAADLAARYRRFPGASVCSNAALLPTSDDRRDERASDELVLGHLGNLSTRKGLDVVLDTVRAVRAAGVPARLLLAGPAGDAEAERLIAAARNEFGDAVTHLGPIPPDEVDAFYRRLDLFLFPSRYVHEAEPLVVLEASRCGVPTVAFGVGCVPALLARPEWIVPTRDDFGAVATDVARSQLDASARAAARADTVTHFRSRREAALDAHRLLRRDLAAPPQGRSR